MQKPLQQQVVPKSISILHWRARQGSYINTAVLEAFAEHLLHSTFMLFLYNTRSRRKDSESTLAHTRIARLAGLE